MKNLTLLIAAVVFSPLTYATSIHVSEGLVKVSNPIEAANLVRQGAVRDCINELEGGKYDAYIDTMLSEQFVDSVQYNITGRLHSGDIAEGKWEIRVSLSFIAIDAFDDGVTYHCEIVKVDIK